MVKRRSRQLGPARSLAQRLSIEPTVSRNIRGFILRTLVTLQGGSIKQGTINGRKRNHNCNYQSTHINRPQTTATPPEPAPAPVPAAAAAQLPQPIPPPQPHQTTRKSNNETTAKITTKSALTIIHKPRFPHLCRHYEYYYMTTTNILLPNVTQYVEHDTRLSRKLLI